MFIWDDQKNATNKEKHGISFEEIHEFEWESATYQNDERHDYGETRCRALGLIDGRMHVVVFTVRNKDVRLISLRRANKREEKLYASLKES